MAEQPYTIRPFDKALHDRGAFSCGVAAMDRWLKHSVTDKIANNRIRLWCAADNDGKMVGFYALAAHSVQVAHAGQIAQRGDRHAIPAIYLVALAVDRTCQRAGLGSALLGDAIARSIAISEQLGAAALILDVLQDETREKRMAFYARLGFRAVDPGAPDRMYLSIKAAKLNYLSSAV